MSTEDLEEKDESIVFKRFMEFLKEAKDRIKRMTSDVRSSTGQGSQATTSHVNFVTGTADRVKRPTPRSSAHVSVGRDWKLCLACNVDGATDLEVVQHGMEKCEVWNSLSLKEKQRKVKCLKHPFHDDHTTGTCTYKGRPCKICSQDGHHFLLCPKASKSAKTSSNSTTMTAINGDGMLPVLLQMQYVFTPGGSGVGTLLYLASTDDYVTHRYARKNKLHGDDVDLIVEGMGGEEKFYKTKLYRVPIKHGDEVYEIPCYGMEKMTSVAAPPEIKSYRKLCKKLKVGAAKVRRPNSIDLLISMRQNFLHPKPVKQMDGITLYGGPLGMVIGGSEGSLVFETSVKCYPLSVTE